ncbi:HAD family hydrolase [Azohydromonas caseinilytica]|uniref:HAD-IB family hydrolase n=1 Tax=Azohydromonas caseinilytica TaxID=2728836 RepID=A0A848F8F7_9BURK|nr:HAD-IB family hydrolase [Azohydromonas caseinilytica]NML15844.1 HAD-IB family hydrolase [Azohydromonas caseinilytica]
MARSQRLALFDLDHTLIPFDSGREWLLFLVERGAVDAAVERRYLESCRSYVSGRCGIEVLHRAVVTPVGHTAEAQIARWSREFEAEMARRVPRSTLALVASHRDAGDRCAIVTTTTRLVAEPFARIFGVPHLLATEPRRVGGWLTGDIEGHACHREHKVTHVQRWLAAEGLMLKDFERSWFYSDAAGDLPLLQAVTDPVAVRPDDRLRAVAQERGWPVLGTADVAF